MNRVGRPKLDEKRINKSILLGEVDHKHLKKDMNRLGLKSFPELLRYYLRLSNGVK